MQPNNGEGTLFGGINTNPILVVDDDPEFAQRVRARLEGCGIVNEVVAIPDGEPAIKYLMACKAAGVKDQTYPALVLIDLLMPTVGGLEVMKWMNYSSMDDIPVIAVSGMSRWGDVASAYEQGAEFFVSKLEQQGLEDKVRHALEVPAGFVEKVRGLRRNPHWNAAASKAA